MKCIALAMAIVALACNKPATAPQSCAPDLAGGRAALQSLVSGGEVVHPSRRVVHLAHVCSLTLDGSAYPVVDLQELVKGETTPRGVNSILIFGPDAKLRRRVEYSTERPLICVGSKLYVWGDLTVEGVRGEGNELQLSADGRELALRHVEANDLPL